MSKPVTFLRAAFLFACVSAAGAACNDDANEFSCENDAGSCFWCTLDKGVSYTCYTTAAAESLKGASCSHPFPTTPTPAPATPTPPPAPAPGACFDYFVKSGDSCYAIETYYGTKNVTMNSTICESQLPLSIGEELKVCGCTAHCGDIPPAPPPAPVVPTPAPGPCFDYFVKSGDSCYVIETYYGTKNVTKNATICESAGMLSIGEELKVCGCTAHCSDIPSAPTPAPVVPTPAPGPCLDYFVKSGDTCYAIEKYYGTKNVTNKNATICESAGVLSVDEELKVCGCTAHCSDIPPAPTPAPVVPTPAPGPKYFCDTAALKCMPNAGTQTKDQCEAVCKHPGPAPTTPTPAPPGPSPAGTMYLCDTVTLKCNPNPGAKQTKAECEGVCHHFSTA